MKPKNSAEMSLSPPSINMIQFAFSTVNCIMQAERLQAKVL